MAFNKFLISSLAVSLISILFSSVAAQIPPPPCTPTMITSFSPCISFVSNSTQNGTTPTSDCCNSLKSLMSSSKDCFCFISTGSAPFQIPINRTLVLSLPRACSMPGVPLQCKVAGAPVPAPALAPGPNGPISPSAAPSPSAQGLAPPESVSPNSAPGADEAPAPPTPTTAGAGGAPASNTGNRAGVTPSAAQTSYSVSPLHLMAVLGAIAFKYYY